MLGMECMGEGMCGLERRERERERTREPELEMGWGERV